MFISYSQNFEDVMLWRALRHIKNGSYIDIGAHDPDVDSVSRLFYENGWRGIHIEPIAHCVQRLGAARPDEVVIQAVAGPKTGTTTFYELSIGGLSTCDREVASHHEATGLGSREYTVPCVTLKDIFAQCASNTVHWLKIDVEGFEKEVLDGWGDSPVRPWIVVIESTYPNSPVSTHQKWERVILGKGYRLAYFDGLNRFYISKAHPELLSAFATPPNVFDDFALSGTGAASFCAVLNGKIHALEGRIREENASHTQMLAERERQHGEELQVRQQHAQQLESDRRASLNRVTELSNEMAELSARLDTSEAESLRMTRELAERDARISSMLRSLSWRLTAPARHVTTWILRKLGSRHIPIYTSEPLSPTGAAASARELIVQPASGLAMANTFLKFKPSSANRYRVEDFLRFDDHAFVEAVYAGLLGRKPDPGDFEYFMGRLRAGVTKVEILMDIRNSSEGELVEARVAGLEFRYKLVMLSRRPVLGPFIGLLFRPVLRPITTPYCRAGDFSDLYDEELILAAYQALLLRVPDPNGYEYYRGMLRDGAERTEILGSVRYSKEGRKVGVIVEGLWAHWMMIRILKLPLVGALLTPFIALFRMPHVLREQRAAENYLMRALATGRVDLKSQGAGGSFENLSHRAMSVLVDLRRAIRGK